MTLLEQDTKAKASISLLFTSHTFQDIYTIYKHMIYNSNATTHLRHAPLILHHYEEQATTITEHASQERSHQRDLLRNKRKNLISL